MTKSNLVGTVGVVLLSMSHTAHAIDECNDATGLPVPVTNTCTVDGNGPGNTCSGDVNGVIHNIIIGSIGDDVIKAKTGNDIVVGLAGFDIICLDQGNDFADAGSGDYVVRAGAGNDMVNTATFFNFPGRTFGGSGNDTLVATFGATSASGQGGNDGLFGDALNDILLGGSGSDFLSGADLDDTLNGGSGAPDACVGGDGNDSFSGCEVVVQ